MSAAWPNWSLLTKLCLLRVGPCARGPCAASAASWNSPGPTRPPLRGGACHLRLVPRSSSLPLPRRRRSGPPQLCWLSRQTRAPRWRRIEVPYCLFKFLSPWPGGPYCSGFCPYSTTNDWPSRAGPRACPSPLRSTSARRRRRGASPRRAARPCLAATHPMASGPGSGPLSAGERRRRRGSSPRRAGSHSPLCFTGPWAQVGLSSSPTSPLYCAACAWSRWARRAGRRWLAATFAGGLEGDVPRPPGPSPCRPVTMGSGAEGGRVLLSRSPAGRSDRPPRARGAAAGVLRSGARPAPRRSAPRARGSGAGSTGSPGLLLFFYSLSLLCCARLVPLGPPRRLAATSAVGTGGGRVPPSRGCVRPARRRGGAEGGTRLPAVRWWCVSPSP
jgi:hypothetical protein